MTVTNIVGPVAVDPGTIDRLQWLQWGCSNGWSYRSCGCRSSSAPFIQWLSIGIVSIPHSVAVDNSLVGGGAVSIDSCLHFQWLSMDRWCCLMFQWLWMPPVSRGCRSMAPVSVLLPASQPPQSPVAVDQQLPIDGFSLQCLSVEVLAVVLLDIVYLRKRSPIGAVLESTG